MSVSGRSNRKGLGPTVALELRMERPPSLAFLHACHMMAVVNVVAVADGRAFWRAAQRILMLGRGARSQTKAKATQRCSKMKAPWRTEADAPSARFWCGDAPMGSPGV